VCAASARRCSRLTETDGVPLRSTQHGARLGCPAAPGSETAGDSAGGGWGQPELSVLVVGVQAASVDGRMLGTALGTAGAGHESQN
jgi:hypothetical protein